ncbi:MAG: LPS export ABC transporter periplasmic protein LptC, partial [Deltaproteobacteria bacterium GWA2_42_85]
DKNLYIFNKNGIILAMRQIKSIVLIIFLTAAVSTIGVLLYINYRIHDVAKGITIKSSGADVRIERARYVETKDGEKEWELEADSAEYFKDNNLAVFDNVKVIFYSKDGINYILTGRQGKLRNDSKDIDITGEVVLTSDDGYKLETGSLKYIAAFKQIKTKDRVIFTGPDIRIEGIGFMADMVKEKVYVLTNVRTVLQDAAI